VAVSLIPDLNHPPQNGHYKYECLGMWDCGMTNHSEAATQCKLPI